MKRFLPAIALSALLGAGCSSSTPAAQTPIQQPTPQIAPPTSAAPTPTTQTKTIKIQNFAYFPVVIKIKKGGKIIFTNTDATPHTATADQGAFNTGAIDSSQSATVDTATLAPGNYPFHCTIHPTMKGTISVE